MRSCWAQTPGDRPTFKQIVGIIEIHLNEYQAVNETSETLLEMPKHVEELDSQTYNNVPKELKTEKTLETDSESSSGSTRGHPTTKYMQIDTAESCTSTQPNYKNPGFKIYLLFI